MHAPILTLLLATLVGLSIGCGTISSYANGCPETFSGVRTDVEYIGDYVSWNDAFDLALVSVDVPLSAAADTVTLPIAVFVRGDEYATYGCGWAKSNQSMAQRSNR